MQVGTCYDVTSLRHSIMLALARGIIEGGWGAGARDHHEGLDIKKKNIIQIQCAGGRTRYLLHHSVIDS